jgi:WS/DGAT/MGAT family acyltransferase
MADRMSAADRSSLAAEHGPVNMTVAGALVFEGGAGLTTAAVAQRIAERIHLLPRYRQRLEEPTGLGFANPVWVDDAHFDIGWHVRHATLPAPGGETELAAYVAREVSERLDRTRPLWEVHVIDGLADGRVAVLPKMHHALVDGVAAIGIGMILLDPTPEPLEIPPPEEPWRPRAYDRRRYFTRLATMPVLRAQRLAFETTLRALETNPRRAADDVRRATELVTELGRQRPQAPMLPFNETISPNRRFAMTSQTLAALKEAGKLAGGTVNDAILAAVTGMLRSYLGERPGALRRGQRPVALVPVSVRRDDDREMGNRISMVFVDLPVEETNPLAQIRIVSSQTRALKASAAVRAGALIAGATGVTPPLVSTMLMRAMGNVRACNLVVSNLPGPQQPFYLCGSRLLEIYPVVPLNPSNQGLSVGILSYDGGVYFGLTASATIDPPVEHARVALERALADIAGVGSAATAT